MREFKFVTALAKATAETFPPAGVSLTSSCLNSLIARSATAFLFIFLGEPISS